MSCFIYVYKTRLYIYIYNKSSIKRNILTIKQNTREVGRAKDLSAPLHNAFLHCDKTVILISVCFMKYRNSCLKTGHDHFVSHIPDFITHSHSSLWL